jgi:hypothetical protein
MEERITAYLNPPPVVTAPTLVVDAAPPVAAGAPRRQASAAELEWLQRHATVAGPITSSAAMYRDQLKHD